MLKIKFSIYLFIYSLIYLFVAKPAYALSTQVSIQQLPSYVNASSFKLSCSAISDNLIDSSSATTTKAQFSYEKDGHGFTNFGPEIDLSNTACQVQVDGGQLDGEGTFTFRVMLDTGEFSSTTTIYDHNGPGTVSNYHKESIGDGFKLYWKNPSDSDFAKVIIYRGETGDFTADASHEITSLPSGAGSDMTYEDHFGPDPSKSYYYNIRAVDKAGNSSDLVGDGGVTVTTSTITQASAQPGSVTVLPKETSMGSVLGTKSTPEAELLDLSSDSGVGIVNQINQFAQNNPEPIRWILTHKKISLGIIVIVALIGYNFIIYSKKRI